MPFWTLGCVALDGVQVRIIAEPLQEQFVAVSIFALGGAAV